MGHFNKHFFLPTSGYFRTVFGITSANAEGIERQHWFSLKTKKDFQKILVVWSTSNALQWKIYQSSGL